MRRQALYFAGPRTVELREETVPAPAPGELLVRTTLTAVSAGTELLLYRGELPGDVAVDTVFQAHQGPVVWPLKYGYCAVGVVVGCGSPSGEPWIGRRVFSFHSHESVFVAAPEALEPVPDDIGDESAVFLPNTETAVGLVMDAAPVIGEQAAILGQGVVGLLTTALLASHPLSSLVTTDIHSTRRRVSTELGATSVVDPRTDGATAQLRGVLARGRGAEGADLCIELSGDPQALSQAIEITGDDGRIVVGSWYGCRTAPLALGGSFHRSRIRIYPSQVSTLAPGLRGRWTKASRLALAWNWVRRLDPRRLITHRFPVSRAPDAYRLLAEDPAEVLQLVLCYPGD
jgi:2-desacetyl-2-hydroxyethyl bacteriochlorophyllide A dehydrogenase